MEKRGLRSCFRFFSHRIYKKRKNRKNGGNQKMNSMYKPEGGRIHSAENRDYLSTPQGMERARLEGVILEGVVTLCDSRLCNAKGIRGFSIIH